MTDVVFHRPTERTNAAAYLWRLPARLARAIDRTLFAHRIRRDLNELPERLRRDIGLIRMALAFAVVVPALLAPAGKATAQDTQIRRGQYLVTLGGCNDCHTPGYFFGKPDMARFNRWRRVEITTLT